MATGTMRPVSTPMDANTLRADKIGTLSESNRELLRWFTDGESDEELAEEFTSGKIPMLRLRLRNQLVIMGFDPTRDREEIRECLRLAFVVYDRRVREERQLKVLSKR